jgi:hypothetical protein
MTTITVSAGAPATDIEPGVYEVELLSVEGPRLIYPQSGVNAGKEVAVLDWTFSLDDNSQLQGTTSTASGPKSKLYAWLTALCGGKPPAIGQKFEPEDLAGRMALATISINDGGWPRIDNLSALPTRKREAIVEEPVQRSRAASKAVARPTDDSLPF